MRSRAFFALIVLTVAVVSGGWLVRRGLGDLAPTNSDRARMFEQVYDKVARLYVDTLADSALVARTIDGLVGELNDPHSAYLSPATLARLSERTTGRYAGVGAQVDVREGWITIVAPLPGGPALAAGIASGDRIVAVDGKSMEGVVLEQAQKALRGPAGSRVRLTVERPGVPTPMEFTLVRREIHVRSVQHAMLFPGNVGYVGLSVFSEESVKELRAAIDSLRQIGMQTLIFDLRGDPGGLLDQGVGVADLFLDRGQRVVSMRGRVPGTTRDFDDEDTQPWPDLLLAILVDSNSASASEIVAGALQDHDRALIMGETTYGKGSAQNVFPLSNGGAVKLTTALWFTPSGRSINRARGDSAIPASDSTKRPTYRTDGGRRVLGGGGITPDLILKTMPISAGDSLFQHALGIQIPKFRDALTNFALSIKGNHEVTSPDFVVTPHMRAELFRRMRVRGVAVDSTIFEGARPLIDRLLGYEIARYSFGEQAEFARRLSDDEMISAARRIVTGARTQAELLSRALSPHL